MKCGLIFFRLKRYIRFLAASRGMRGHGIHSPFVYDLVTRVIVAGDPPAAAGKVEMIRRDMMKDGRFIEQVDLKTGCGRVKARRKRIAGIARSSPVSRKYGVLLHDLAAGFGSDLILELGTSLGISSMYMALAAPQVPLITLEGSRQAADVAEENFRKAGTGNIRIICGLFSDTLPQITEMRITPGLVFIDGDHRREALLSYFDSVAGIAGDNTVVVIDDINYSPEMAGAWREIMKHGKVTLSIDLYRMGIVFFRKGMVLNHYVIRY